MKYKLDSIVWIFYDEAELISHSTIWKFDGTENILIFYSIFTLNSKYKLLNNDMVLLQVVLATYSHALHF